MTEDEAHPGKVNIPTIWALPENGVHAGGMVFTPSTGSFSAWGSWFWADVFHRDPTPQPAGCPCHMDSLPDVDHTEGHELLCLNIRALPVPL